MKKPILLTVLCLAVGACRAVAEPPPASPHPVVARLVTEGFPLDDGVVVKLPAPLLSDPMSGDEQRAAMTKLFGAARFKQYMQNRVVAPQKIKVETERKLGKAGAVRRLSQYFVAYGDLEVIRNEELMKGFMAREKEEEARDAKPEKFEQILEPRGEAAEDAPPGKPYLYRYRFPLLDKVVISGLVEGQSFSRDGLLIESSVSDRRLLDDADDPTVWRAIPRRARGDVDLLPPEPFRGLAGYLQVTQLKFEPTAMLIECHGVLIEPTGWFGGKNLLASKLPLVGQENVRSFRRKLAKFNAEQAAAAPAE